MKSLFNRFLIFVHLKKPEVTPAGKKLHEYLTKLAEEKEAKIKKE